MNRDQSFENENKRLQIESLEKNKTEVEEELVRMKESWERSKADFIASMKYEHSRQLDTIDELRKNMDKHEMQLNLTTSKGMSNSNHIKELQNRSEELHRVVEKC